MKSDFSPMNLADLMSAAPGCTATSKRSGNPCGAPAVKRWRVFRFHRARHGAPSEERHGIQRNGARTNEAQVARKLEALPQILACQY